MITRLDENAICIANPACSQLFVLYGGLVNNTPETALAITKTTGLSDRNVIFLNDPYFCSFRKGIGPEVDSLPALATWLQAKVTDLRHVRATYHVGFSSGAFPALVTACRLGSERAWAFGARPSNVTHELGDQFKLWMGDSSFAHLAKFFDEHTEEEEFRLLVDLEFSAECAAVIERCRQDTRLDYYFCTANWNDSKVAMSLKECRAIDFHPISISEEQLDILVRRALERQATPGLPHWSLLSVNAAKRLFTHLPLRIMADTGRNVDLFPAFESATSP